MTTEQTNQETLEELTQETEPFEGITIETRRYTPFNMFERVEKYIDLRHIISRIQFSQPVKDFKENEHNELYLETTWFGEGRYYWMMQLEDKNRAHIQSIHFNEIDEHFSSYTKERLKRWQDTAVSTHQKYLLRIEDLYWQNKAIPKDFFE